MILVARHNGKFFRAQTVTNGNINAVKQSMLKDKSDLTFELVTIEEFEQMENI